MKWVVVTGWLVCLVGYGEGSALRCTEADHAICAQSEEEVPPPPVIVSQEVLESTASPSGQVECLAGSEWESNCHYCRCSESGVAECLKQDPCSDGVFAEPLQCKPNTTFTRDCNTCACLDSGLALCTVDHCRRTGIPKKSELVAGNECATGSTWKTKCSECRCTDAGYGECTPLPCDANEKDIALRCAPDTMWRRDCNTCWCTADGRGMCTKIGCATITNLNFDKISDGNNEDKDFTGPNLTASRRKRATPQEAPKNCQPGQEFRLDCNKCLCDNEGQDFSCTRIDCNANNNNGGVRSKRETGDLDEISSECTPGSVFQRDCNTCRCTADGRHALCTHKSCQKVEPKGNQLDSDVHSTEPDPGFRCDPGEQFKRDCKDCTCSADGKSYFCTIHFCDEFTSP